MRLYPSIFGLIAASLAISLLAGCSANFAPSDVAPEQTPIGTLQGSVHGGNLPVIGAQIYLLAASTSGYGTTATSLMTSGKSGISCSNPALAGACYATTDGNGNFAIGGDYACTQGQQVYMVAVAGNPGLTGVSTTATFSTNSSTITVASATGISTGATVGGSGVSGTVTAVSGTTVTLSNKTTSAGSGVSVTFSVNNNGDVQMAALGTCPASGSMASQVPYLVINEVTTVAFAYSVGGFATTAYNVSADTTGASALANAFANANNIVNLGNGTALATVNGNSDSVSPQSKINALANILATCVNTTTNSSTQCANLFKYATTSTGTQATDEANAMFNIVHNQTQNVANIYNLGSTTPIFYPTLTAQPTDWTMPVIYNSVISAPDTTSPITSGPYNIAFDASGNAWIGDRGIGVVEIGGQGAVTKFANSTYGFGMVKGVAVSPQDGSIWVSDYVNNDVYVMNSTGTNLAKVTQNLKSNGPILTAFASNPAGGDYLAFQATETSTGIVIFDAGTYAQDHNADNSNYTNVSDPGWITVDDTGSAWIPSTNTTYIGGLAVSNKNGSVKYTTSQTNVGATYQTVAEAEGAASDGLGNVWAPSGAGLYEVTTGTVTGGYTGGGMNNPSKTFIDGGNVVWVASASANTVSGLKISSSAWLSSTGFATSPLSGTGCSVIGVDPSGNVWSGNSDQSVTELLGLGTPTAAPLYAGNTVVTGTGGSAVTTVTKGNLGTKP